MHKIGVISTISLMTRVYIILIPPSLNWKTCHRLVYFRFMVFMYRIFKYKRQKQRKERRIKRRKRRHNPQKKQKNENKLHTHRDFVVCFTFQCNMFYKSIHKINEKLKLNEWMNEWEHFFFGFVLLHYAGKHACLKIKYGVCDFRFSKKISALWCH